MFDVAVENGFDFGSSEYAALFAASQATAFQHPKWLLEFYRRLPAVNHAAPLIVVVRQAKDKSLALVLPLVRRRYGLLSVVEFADLRVSDYAAMIARSDAVETILAQAELLQQFRQLLKPYDVLRIGKLGEAAPRMNTLLGVAEPKRMPTNAYAVPLDTSFDAWRASHLDRSYAKELAKKMRQLERKGQVVFEQVRDPAAVRQTFEAMRRFRRDRFEVNGGGELLQIPAYFDFYLAVGLDPSFARPYRLTLDGTIIATALGLSVEGSLLVVLSGFTQTEHKNQSIGSLLFELIAKDCIARGDTLLDFTIGDEPYKKTFGATPTPIWQVSRAGSPVGFAASVMVERMPAVRALARNLFHRGKPKDPQGGTPQPAEA